MNKSNALSDEIKLWGMEENYTLFTDNSIGFGLEISPIDVSTSSDDFINDFSARLKNFLNALPENLDIQFVQDIKSGNTAVLNQCLTQGESCTNVIAKDLLGEKVESFKSLDEDGLLPKYTLKVFVRRAFSSSITKPSIFKSNDEALEITEAKLEHEISLIEKIKQNLIDSFESLGLSTKEIEAGDLLSDVYQQWNPGRELEFKHFNPENVRGHLLYTDTLITEKGFQIGDHHHRVISLKNLPEYTRSSMVQMLRHLPFDSNLFVSIHVPGQDKEQELIKAQRRVAFSMSSGQTGVSDIESNSKYQDLEETLNELINDGEKIFYLSLNILLRSTNLDELSDKVTDTLYLLRELAGSEGLVETVASFDVFKNLSLPHAKETERRKRLKTSNLVDFLPVYAPWTGHKDPSLILRSAMGNLVSFNPFDESHANANQLISAGSGAGKSVFTNLFMLQMLKHNPKIFFVDIGGSYKKLCENLNGEYIPLGVDENISINPFDLPSGETSPSHHKVKFLVGLIELMTKEDHEASLPRLVRSLLEDAIMTVYKTTAKPRMNDLKDLLLKSGSDKVVTIGQILGSWCGESAFGQFIDKETNVELSNNLIAFDLKGLEAYPELQTVCLYLITDLIWSQIQKDRYNMKFVVFDECWKLLKDSAGQSFIESIFRTCRKYFTSCIAISQAIQDFSESPISSAIIPNCSIKWLLQQGQSDSTVLQKVLGLNDNEVSLIQSLKQKKGHFSESYLISGTEKRSVVQVEPTPLELWLATTNPKDLKLFEDYKHKIKNEDQFEILKKLAKLYPNGKN